MTIDLSSSVPLTEQIVAGVRRGIASGELAVDAPLPSVRQLAGDLGVNLNTVARAYRTLEEHGLVVTRRGRGTRVSADRQKPTSKREALASLSGKLRTVLADARLAGLDAASVRRLADREVRALWKEDVE